LYRLPLPRHHLHRCCLHRLLLHRCDLSFSTTTTTTATTKKQQQKQQHLVFGLPITFGFQPSVFGSRCIDNPLGMCQLRT
jgi:hypothetical protein